MTFFAPDRRHFSLLLAGVGASAVLTGLSACSPKPKAAAPEIAADPAFEALLAEIAVDAVRDVPEAATSLGLSEEQAGGRYKDRLGDRSQGQYERDRLRLMSWREKIAAFDRAKLSPAQAVSHDVMSYQFGAVADGAGYGHGNLSPIGWFAPYVMTQLNGAYLEIPDFLDSQHKIETLDDGKDYLARLGQIASVMDGELGRARLDVEMGIVPPAFVFERMTIIIDRFLSVSPTDNVLASSLARRIAALPGADPAVVKTQKDEAIRIVTRDIYPAYQRLRAWTAEMAPKGSKDAGIWQLKAGADYYKTALKLFTTTEMTPEEVHESGQKIIETLSAEADQILRAQGLVEGSVGQRLKILAKDPKYLYSNDDAGREKLLADLNGQITRLKARLPEMFGILPKADVEVRRVPVFTEAGAPGGYYQSPSLNGSRPGAYYINLRDTAEWPSWTLPTLTYHEASPGHHLQGTIALERQDLPLIRRMLWNSAYGEGWALYAEQVADELGLYDGDPVGRLGYLQSMLFRAARLVVDTGLHSLKWTREEAITRMAAITGDDESAVATEVERYCVWPGQACSYMTGRVKINALRDGAKREMKHRFDIKAFHDVVLGEGALPLDVLAERVNAWAKA